MEELGREDHMTVYGVDGDAEFVTVSMGVAYKLDDDIVGLPLDPFYSRVCFLWLSRKKCYRSR